MGQATLFPATYQMVPRWPLAGQLARTDFGNSRTRHDMQKCFRSAGNKSLLFSYSSCCVSGLVWGELTPLTRPPWPLCTPRGRGTCLGS